MFSETHEKMLRALADSYIPVARSVGADKPALLCPVCHDEYVHPVAVCVVPAGRSSGALTVTAAGLRLDPTVAPIGRGVAITLSFVCEQGHEFEYMLHFHKGMTFIERCIGPTYSNPCDAPDTIWRD